MSQAQHEFARRRRADRRSRRLEEYRRGLRPFAIAAWEITKEHNVGSLVRTAHAVAASEVILVGGRDWNVEAACTAELFTDIVQLPADPAALFEHLDRRRFTLVSVEIAAGSVSLFDACYPERPCFLLGAERGGLPAELLAASELVVEIPQWGLVPSLNLAVAGSLVVYDFLGKRHRAGVLDRPGGGLVGGAGPGPGNPAR
jgi:tRNA G18 (ribose-2'-O)-methylase SpoU